MPMSVKRKSNWYIYVITLIVSFIILGFFVSSIWDSLFPASKDAGSYTVGGADYRPSAEIQTTVLLMLSEMKAGTPKYYMLMHYYPRQDSVVFAALPENMRVEYGGNEGSLYEMYDNFGASAVMGGIKNTLGIECDNYIKFDRLSFIDFVDLTGTVYVNVPSDITEQKVETVLVTEIIDVDGEEQEVTRQKQETVDKVIFPAGTQYFDGETLYSYLVYPFGKGADYTLAIHGSAAMNMVNRNFRSLSSTELQARAEKLLGSTDTDFTFSDYTDYQSVLLYTSENSINPCEYYIPYGETDGGYFVIASNSINTIRDRFGMTELEAAQ